MFNADVKSVEMLFLLFVTGDMKSTERGRALFSSLFTLNVFPVNALKVLREKAGNADNYAEYFINKGDSIDCETLVAILEFYHRLDCYDGGYSSVFDDFFTSGKFKNLISLLKTDNTDLAEHINNIAWEDWSNE